MQTFTAGDVVAAVDGPRFRERLEAAFAPSRLAEFVTMLDSNGLPLEAWAEAGRLRFEGPQVSVAPGELNVVIHYDRIVAIGVSLVLQALNVSGTDIETIAVQIDERERAAADVRAEFAEFNLEALLRDVDVDLETNKPEL